MKTLARRLFLYYKAKELFEQVQMFVLCTREDIFGWLLTECVACSYCVSLTDILSVFGSESPLCCILACKISIQDVIEASAVTSHFQPSLKYQSKLAL